MATENVQLLTTVDTLNYIAKSIWNIYRKGPEPRPQPSMNQALNEINKQIERIPPKEE
jgi:hypothetical protein